MKISNGKIKLTKNDRQYGNFVVTTEPEHYKIQAVNLHWSLRVAKITSMGRMIEEGLADKDNEDGFLRILTYFYTMSSTIGDTSSIRENITSLSNAAKRISIKNGTPVVVYGSADELVEDMLYTLESHNVWLSESEIHSIVDILRANYEANRETYNPQEMEKASQAALEQERLKEEEMSKVKEQSSEN